MSLTLRSACRELFLDLVRSCVIKVGDDELKQDATDSGDDSDASNEFGDQAGGLGLVAEDSGSEANDRVGDRARNDNANAAKQFYEGDSEEGFNRDKYGAKDAQRDGGRQPRQEQQNNQRGRRSDSRKDSRAKPNHNRRNDSRARGDDSRGRGNKLNNNNMKNNNNRRNDSRARRNDSRDARGGAERGGRADSRGRDDDYAVDMRAGRTDNNRDDRYRDGHHWAATYSDEGDSDDSFDRGQRPQRIGNRRDFGSNRKNDNDENQNAGIGRNSHTYANNMNDSANNNSSTTNDDTTSKLKKLKKRHGLPFSKKKKFFPPAPLAIICDEPCLRALNSFCKFSDLYELGVTSVESLEFDRDQNDHTDALYFIDPDRLETRKRLLGEWQDEKEKALARQEEEIMNELNKTPKSQVKSSERGKGKDNEGGEGAGPAGGANGSGSANPNPNPNSSGEEEANSPTSKLKKRMQKFKQSVKDKTARLKDKVQESAKNASSLIPFNQKKTPKHRLVHLLLSREFSQKSMELLITGSVALTKRIQSVREVPVGSFVAFHENAFFLEYFYRNEKEEEEGGKEGDDAAGGRSKSPQSTPKSTTGSRDGRSRNRDDRRDRSNDASTIGRSRADRSRMKNTEQIPNRTLDFFYPKVHQRVVPHTVESLAQIVRLLGTTFVETAAAGRGRANRRNAKRKKPETKVVPPRTNIRFQVKSSPDNMSQRIAHSLDFMLQANEAMSAGGEFRDINDPDSDEGPAAEVVDVLIVERAMDVAAIFVHEWTHEALVHDILDVGAGSGYSVDLDRGIFRDEVVAAKAEKQARAGERGGREGDGAGGGGDERTRDRRDGRDGRRNRRRDRDDKEGDGNKTDGDDKERDGDDNRTDGDPKSPKKSVDSLGAKLRGSRLLSDDIWERLRSIHFFRSQNMLKDEVQKMRTEYADMQKIKQGKNARIDTETLAGLVRQMPEYQELIGRYGFHLDLCDRMQREIDRSRMLENGAAISLFEQNLCCGVDEQGREVRPVSKYSEKLHEILESDRHSSIPSQLKLRLLLLYFACLDNVGDKTANQVLEAARLTPSETTIVNRFLRSGLAGDAFNFSAEAKSNRRRGSDGRGGSGDLRRSETGVSMGGGRYGNLGNRDNNDRDRDNKAGGMRGALQALQNRGGNKDGRGEKEGGGKKEGKLAHRQSKPEIQKYKKIAVAEGGYTISRFQPRLSDVVESILQFGGSVLFGAGEGSPAAGTSPRKNAFFAGLRGKKMAGVTATPIQAQFAEKVASEFPLLRLEETGGAGPAGARGGAGGGDTSSAGPATRGPSSNDPRNQLAVQATPSSNNYNPNRPAPDPTQNRQLNANAGGVSLDQVEIGNWGFSTSSEEQVVPVANHIKSNHQTPPESLAKNDRTPRNQSYQNPTPKAAVPRKKVMVVFVGAGVTLSEIRDLERLGEYYGIQLVIGGSCLLTPKRALAWLKEYEGIET